MFILCFFSRMFPNMWSSVWLWEFTIVGIMWSTRYWNGGGWWGELILELLLHLFSYLTWHKNITWVQIQELVEAIVLPMTHKDRFQKLGIRPPKGVLLYGPPGTGKTLMARACAAQTNATFLKLAGPQLVQVYCVCIRCCEVVVIVTEKSVKPLDAHIMFSSIAVCC